MLNEFRAYSTCTLRRLFRLRRSGKSYQQHRGRRLYLEPAYHDFPRDARHRCKRHEPHRTHNFSSAFNLARHGYLNKRIFFQLLTPTILGALLGACFLVHIGDKLFQAILAVVICLVVVMSNLKKDVLGKPPATPPEKLTLKGALGFFAIAIYGCIVQVGVGFVQIFGLTRYTGLAPIQINALKNSLTNVFLAVSTFALGVTGKINWPIAVFMAGGAWVGGYFGSFLQRKKGNKFIQRFISICSIGMAIALVVDLIVK